MCLEDLDYSIEDQSYYIVHFPPYDKERYMVGTISRHYISSRTLRMLFRGYDIKNKNSDIFTFLNKYENEYRFEKYDGKIKTSLIYSN